MNCKPGDLAIFVGGSSEACMRNQGRLFDVIRRDPDSSNGPSWIVKPVGSAFCRQAGGFFSGEGSCLDKFLRPIRGEDGEDEIIRIAGKPEGVTA